MFNRTHFFEILLCQAFLMLVMAPALCAETVVLRGYQIRSLPVKSYGSTTTFSYEICSATGGADGDLFVVEMPSCLPTLSLLAVGNAPSSVLVNPLSSNLPASSFSVEPKTPLRGVQFKPRLAAPGCRTLSLSFEGNRVVSADRGVGIATTQGAAIAQFPGPACDTGGALTCGASAPADVLFMFDVSKSISSTALQEARRAASELTSMLASTAHTPRIGVATFNVSTKDSARLIQEFESFSSYSYPLETIQRTLAKLPAGSGASDFAAAITYAEQLLRARDPIFEKFLILFTDGQPDRPNSASSDHCLDPEGATWAQDAATTAKSHGIKIFTVHLHSSDGCSDAVGSAFLKTQLASGFEYSSESWDDLSKFLSALTEARSCNDGNSCTIDQCIEPFYLCRHTGLTQDGDSDQTPDCRDLCPGANDALINTSCSAGVGQCQTQGVNQCSAGQIRCSAAPRPSSTEVCNAKDDDCDGQIDEGIPGGCPVACGSVRGCGGCVQISTAVVKERLVSYVGGLVSVVETGLMLSDKEPAGFEASVRKQAQAYRDQALDAAGSLPSALTRCRSSFECPTKSNLEPQERYDFALGKLVQLFSSVLQTARHNGADRARVRRLIRQGRRATISARALLRRTPNVVPACG